MSLTCTCYDYDPEPGMIYYSPDEDYSTLTTKRSRKCLSCHDKIVVNAIVVGIDRFKVPETDIEIKIYGEDGQIPLPPKFLCETCGDLLFSFEDLGFCGEPWKNQKELLKDYQMMVKNNA